jgi:hypothetical protein
MRFSKRVFSPNIRANKRRQGWGMDVATAAIDKEGLDALLLLLDALASIQG